MRPVVRSSTRASWRMLKMKRKRAELQARRGRKKRGAEKGQKKQEGRRNVLDLDDLVLANADKLTQIRDLLTYRVAESSARASWRMLKMKRKTAELQAWRGTKKRGAEKGQKKQEGRRHVLDPNIIEVYTHPGPFDAPRPRGEVIGTRILPKDGDCSK